MPIRVYRCREGHETEVALPSGDYAKTHPCKFCTDDSARSVPARIAISTTVGEQIRELKKKGLIPFEKGMDKDAERARGYKQEKHEQRLTAIVDEVIRADQTIRPD
jgi:hypothetical protein